MKKETLRIMKKHSPKESLDQNFMADAELIKKIVSMAEIKPNEKILEIGPGFGFLTRELCKKTKKLVAVEKDRRFEPFLAKEFGKSRIIIGDILKVIDSISFDKIVSNVPYSISEPLLQKLFHIDFKLAALTLPKKFVYRMLAKENQKNYSKLSLLSKVFFSIEIKQEIPRNAFYPQPKTNSVAVVLRPSNNYLTKKIFLQNNRKVKNAILEVFCKEMNKTKKQSREIIKRLKTNKYLLDTKVKDLDMKQAGQILRLLEKYRKAL